MCHEFLPAGKDGGQVRDGRGTIFRIAGRFWVSADLGCCGAGGEHHWRVAHVLVSGGDAAVRGRWSGSVQDCHTGCRSTGHSRVVLAGLRDCAPSERLWCSWS